MEGFLIALVSVVFVLGVLILVHEFGHFAAAKLFGVRVETFSLGFGKRLIGFRRGDTDYRISALPFGGYVKMTGETPLDSRTGAPEEFMSHPRWQRIVIALAGPAMNIGLAILLLTAIFMVHYERQAFLDEKAQLGYILPNSPADRAGLKVGDIIVRVNGVENPTWEDVTLKTMVSPNTPVKLSVLRGNQILPLTVTPEKGPDEQALNPGWVHDEPNVVTGLDPNMPAAKAGLQVGDTIVSVNGTPIHATKAMIDIFQQTKGTPADVAVQRNGQIKHFTVTPVEAVDQGEKYYRIGMISEPKIIDTKLPFPKALRASLEENKRYSLLVFDIVHKLLRRDVSIKTMSSPIGIAKASGEAARQPGWTPLLTMMVMISLQLGIFNLFPIPILDGGMILMLLIEGFIRRDISMRIKERAYQVAFVCLILFAAVVIYNDIMKNLPGVHH